ncbi:hypothetical protein [Sulfitobacter sp. SK011]|uniref:hypothetical protein n=1 Tax=Sulfitobacter sp. SK011 TaxID=1389004 RepID=UPI000E0B6CB9|nr:hypothetical protein [Sulfitobacter sp. SK011]AXI41750.1 hypothetical protein C1J02_07190 [Sulfitobacter sp. SK011]
MKPNFALSLSFEGIRLLHRAAGGWRVVGAVALDAANMADELAVLRRTASSLEPGGVRAKLLVPNEQIKYLTIPTPDMTDAARRQAAKDALDGATPYAVDDLAFDISLDGDQTHIAAVARETLDEAEAFAVEHRFHPVSFAAIPTDQPYLGEPFFGPTAIADELLEDGETVEPDGIAVVVIGDVQTADIGAPKKGEPSEAIETASEPEDAEKSDQSDVKDTSAPEKHEPKQVKPTETAAPDLKSEEKDVDPASAAKPEEDHTPTAKQTSPDKAEPKSDTPVLPSTRGETETTATPKTADKPPATPQKEAEPAVANPVRPSAPALGSATRGTAVPSFVPPSVQAAPSPTAQKTANAPAAGFASRRSADTPGTSTTLPGARREPSLGEPFSSNAADADRSPGISISDPSLPVMDEAIKPDSSSLAPQIPDAAAPAKAGFLSRRKSKTPPPVNVAPQRQPEPGAAVAKPRTEAERMTVFGARRADVGGKPRFLGLILTAALLVILAGVAAWASVFRDDGFSLSRLFGDRSPRATASIPAPPEDTDDGVEIASLEPGLTGEDAAVLDALRDPIVPVPVPEMTEAEVEAKYAATGIWPRAPEVPPEPASLIDIEDLYMTSIDPVSTSTDAVALPAAEGYLTDVVFASVPSPAAAGTQFAYDANGLLIPTAQGSLSPDGFTVFAGRPPVVPTAFPDRTVAAPEAQTLTDPLAELRPRPRPGNLAETTERAQLDGLTKSELAGYRPQLRPASVQEQAAAAAASQVVDTQTFDTSEAVAAALAGTPAPAPAIENATRFAVQASLRPDTRPRNFARIVKRAQRAAPQQQATQVASAAAVAPKVVTPSVPSKASVARQATVKNAINLRKVNLIGVYGKPSSRRALVRLSNGRYKKVVVGDRIDGGRVSAIGDSELRYTKNGRNVVLKMPNG